MRWIVIAHTKNEKANLAQAERNAMRRLVPMLVAPHGVLGDHPHLSHQVGWTEYNRPVMCARRRGCGPARQVGRAT
jgi:hypothetical protein